MARNVYYVLSDEGDWKVTRQGGVVIGTHANKDSAIIAAVTIAKFNQPSQVKVLQQDGTWDEGRTYGDDPQPPKGQERASERQARGAAGSPRSEPA
jgi:hypothetical protein